MGVGLIRQATITRYEFLS